ncbi:phasin family protein [Stenotrophomonas sp. CFBP 13724]|uniref:phasin family protein n=1 Tax=Stenotrophomonas sp. CFBP 13724 TaxID=2775298 RepID=UPI0017832A82|nr:phasin family protein [Stenotrophomonas sp. CFBP 13724]MBD8643416.1 phasin family protein [Stenotrophomonas sp. CFBP 13724]
MNQYDEHDPRNDGQDKASFQDQAERVSRKLSDSAQQVWLAGLGALGRAQAEGSRFFDSLVKEGEAFESRRREKSTEDGPGWRDNVEEQLGQAREKAAGTWDKVEKAFEDRVHGVLKRLHVPNAEDVSTLNARIDALTTRLNRLESRQASAASGEPTPGSHQSPTGS